MLPHIALQVMRHYHNLVLVKVKHEEGDEEADCGRKNSRLSRASSLASFNESSPGTPNSSSTTPGATRVRPKRLKRRTTKKLEMGEHLKAEDDMITSADYEMQTKEQRDAAADSRFFTRVSLPRVQAASCHLKSDFFILTSFRR